MKMFMQKMQSVLGWQVLILLCVGSYVWSKQLPDDYDLRRLYSYAYKRYPSYDFGLGKRSLEEPASYEDTGYPYPLDAYNNYAMDKRAAPSGMYSFGLGKRNQRVYGFGLGKRLEQAWKGANAPSTAMFPTYRQERRSKIYSFGLGKRQSADLQEDDYEFPAAASANSDKRSSQARQFSFGLGKRDTESSDHVKSTS
ncbi:unnamed protein product [Orchesella dallaii]|uniref:Allatostatin A n=1 Tax=Orchesella dallaii TaxID=48710 RepID=A0ABP1PVZ6_9HEXA